MTIRMPASVPAEAQEIFAKNMERLTQGTGRVMLFAGDQKVEHLNEDFYPFEDEAISLEDNDPAHLFKIAKAAGNAIGAFATQYGLISTYGPDYPEVPYIIKLNSKSDLVTVNQADPISTQWVSIDQVVALREMSGLHIVGVGYTIYLGSEHENAMLTEAEQLVIDAHAAGLPVFFWIYPRGKSLIKKEGDQTINLEKHPTTISGAAGVGAALGADFVKLNPPEATDGKSSAEWLKVITEAAGLTKVICAGGSSMDPEKFLAELYDQIHIGGTSGNATGRNIHQRSLEEAVSFCKAIAAITYGDKDVAYATEVYKGEAQ